MRIRACDGELALGDAWADVVKRLVAWSGGRVVS